jgi:N-methylhydantoinase A
MPCNPSTLPEIAAAFSELEEEARGTFRQESFPLDRVWVERFLDLRYKGQEHTVRTPVHEDVLENKHQFGRLIEKFHELHEQAYSFRQDDPVEIVNFHVVGWGEVDKPAFKPLEEEGRSLDRASKGERPVHFQDVGTVDSKVYERNLLPPHVVIDGPAVVEEPACTTIVCPGQQVTVDRFGNLVITEVSK